MAEVRPAHLAAARHLEWIHSNSGGGTGGHAFPAMVESPVVMSNSRGISADTIAEHVLAVTLVMFRKLPFAFEARRGEWAQDAILAGPPIRTIGGSSVLVVGLGGIGTATARRMAALGARVTGIRRIVALPAPEGVDAVLPPERLLDPLPHADIVVIAAPQTAHTHGLIGAGELAAMRRDALLVNVSRGKLVDEAALAAALELPATAGPLAAPPSTSSSTNPCPGQPVVDAAERARSRPTWPAFAADHWDAVTTLFAENLRRFESGQPLLNVVDKVAGY